MKERLNKKIIAAVVISAAFMGLVYNYFYPKGIPYFKTEEKIPWADTTLSIDTSKVLKSQKEFFSQIPPEKVHSLSEARININRSKLQLITLSQTYSLFSSDTAVFIDARDKWDFAEGHIPGALNIPNYNFNKDNPLLKTIPKRKTIVVYCGGDDCDASLALAKQLQKLNYSILYVFSGGWGEWTKAGYKVEKGNV